MGATILNIDVNEGIHGAGSLTIGVVLDDNNGITGFVSLGGTLGMGLSSPTKTVTKIIKSLKNIFSFTPMFSYNPLAKTIKDFEGLSQSFSSSVQTPIFTGSISAGLDGTFSLSGTKGSPSLSASVDYNAGYTWLNPLEYVRFVLSFFPNGKNTFNSMKRQTWNLRSKVKK